MTPNTPPNLADHVDLTVLAADGAHPGWKVLDTARDSQFTGEIVFPSSPEIRAYFDNGVAYHAVRAGDPTICERLLEAEVVEAAQLERGVVRVGNVAHLGRLFDRDPSVDRDAVMVLIEMGTDSVLTELANRETSAFSITAYRHHVSGVHRWFVAPTDPMQLSPVGEVGQIDTSIVCSLPGLPVANHDETDELHIEWDYPIIDGAPVSHEPPLIESDTSSSEAPTLEPDHPAPTPEAEATPEITADAAPEEAPAPMAPHAPLLGLDEFVVSPYSPTVPSNGGSTSVPSFEDEFQIVWPDGTEQILPAKADDEYEHHSDLVDVLPATTSEPDSIVEPPVAATAPPIVVDVPADVSDPTPAEVEPSVDSTPTVTVAKDGAIRFDIPELEMSGAESPDDEQSSEVVDAVRRALHAIEAATSPEAGTALSEPPTAVFAAPTLETSAEAIYARAATAAVDGTARPDAGATPAPGVASVVFVDDDAENDGGQRSGALRRLIGSLRRK